MSVAQLSRLLPLPEEELKQVLDYAATLSKAEAVEHFGNLLGDTPDAIDFISSFNSRRQEPKAATTSQSRSQSHSQTQSPSHSDIDAVPKHARAPKKKKANLHTPAPRQVASLGPTPGTAYSKKNIQDDYISRKPSPGPSSNAFPLPGASRPPPKSATPPPPKLPPSAAGHLISEAPRAKPKSTPGSRSSTPAPKTKVNISGGTAMHGASTALSDLDAAIRALEMTTNPTRDTDDAARKCNCVAARHPLLAAAPNCLQCGKVVCLKEGLGPCTFCGTPILSSTEVQSMIHELKQERGRERMAADKEAHRKAEVSKKPAPFSKPREVTGNLSEAEAKAKEHRDRLLGFQAQNAQRTTVRDEASDFDVTGASMWASPEERARELKRQQKLMREMEWNARPEYEKRKQVVSIDIVKGKVVRKIAAMERPDSPEDDVEIPSAPVLEETSGNRGKNGGAFSRNPLLGGLIKPVFDAKGKGAELEGRQSQKTKWRKVQDDLDNNEGVILDGGAYGGPSANEQATTGDEPACG